MINFASNLNKMIDAGLGGPLDPPRTEVAVGHRVVYKEASGTVVNFESNMIAPVKNLRVTMEPIQEGTGDPSPDNIRPITGRESVTVSNVAQLELGSTATAYEPYDGQSVTIQLGQTVYGGTVDVTEGELTNGGVLETVTANNGAIESEHFKDYSASVSVLGNCVRITLNRRSTSDGLNVSSSSYAIKMCSMLPHAFSYASDTPHWYINNQMYIFLPVSIGTTLAAAAAYLAAHPIQIYIPFATPVETAITPVEMTTLHGQNNVWSDAGDISLEYPYYEETEGY